MRNTITIHAVPLWPLVKNTFVISLVLLTVTSLILAFLWLGFLRQFSGFVSDPAMDTQLQYFQSLGGVFVFFFALFNGIFGSILVTIVAGLGGLLYNLLNSKGQGIELEVTLASAVTLTGSEPDRLQEASGADSPSNPPSGQAHDSFPGA